MGLSGGCGSARCVVTSNHKYRDISPGCRIENPKDGVYSLSMVKYNSSSYTLRIRRLYAIVAAAEVVIVQALGWQGSCMATFISEVLFSVSSLPLC